MSVYKGQASQGGPLIVLGREDTKLWESGEPAGYEFRARVRKVAAVQAKLSKRPVQIIAAAGAGSYTADWIGPRDGY